MVAVTGADPEAGPLADALAGFPTGVVLLAVHDEEDGDAVITLSAFTSVSLEPPLVLVGVVAGSWMHEVLERTGSWAVSVLAVSHRSLAARFAAPQRPSPRVLLAGVPHGRGRHTGAIVLDEAVAVLECRTERQVEAGDHVLVFGSVLGATAAPQQADAQPPEIQPLVRVHHRYTGVRGEGR